MKLPRRRFITGAAISAAALAAAGLVYEWTPDAKQSDPKYRYTMLSDEDRVIIATIAPVMLGVSGTLPLAVRGVDAAIKGLPLAVRAQVHQLFGILRFPLSRMFVAGIWHPWHDANPAEIEGFLTRWRYSPIAQLRGAYDALHQLTMAAWYGNDVAWKAIAYPGPPRIE